MNNKIIAVINLKGGTGKTTTSVGLAEELSKQGYKVQLKDSGSQASTTMWIDNINEDIPFHFEITNKTQLGRNSDKFDFTVIDFDPFDSSVIDSGIKVADYIVIPSAPSGLDLSRVFEMIPVMASNYSVLLTMANPRTQTYKYAKALLEEENIRVFDNFIPLRESVKRSFGTLNELEGYRDVAVELLRKLNINNQKSNVVEPTTNGKDNEDE